MDGIRKIIKPVSFDESLIGRKSVYIDVPGEPFAKQRPRAARKGRFITIYTPKETKQYEEKVRKYYNRYYRGTKLEGDLSVDIEGVFSIPKSVSKKKHEEILMGDVPHTKKPDCDNMGKVCLDALNGVAYDDDAQINRLVISKKYGEDSKVRITIKENKLLPEEYINGKDQR